MNIRNRAKSCPASRALLVQTVPRASGFVAAARATSPSAIPPEGLVEPPRLDSEGRTVVRIVHQLGILRSTIGYGLRQAETSRPRVFQPVPRRGPCGIARRCRAGPSGRSSPAMALHERREGPGPGIQAEQPPSQRRSGRNPPPPARDPRRGAMGRPVLPRERRVPSRSTWGRIGSPSGAFSVHRHRATIRRVHPPFRGKASGDLQKPGACLPPSRRRHVPSGP